MREGETLECQPVVEPLLPERSPQVARTANTGSRTLETESIEWQSKASAWLEAKERYDAAKKEMDKYRPSLMEALDELGDEDENGHRFLDLPVQVGKWVGLQRQRRVTDTVDEQAALELLKEKGLEDRCVKMVPQIDQDAIYAALYEGLLSEDDIYAMFPPRVTYALVAVKA